MTSSARWAWTISVVAATGAALVLAFVLSFSTQGGGFYERHFVWLFWVNVAVAALLALVIATAALRLVVRARRGKFGSRLLIKLAGIFALVGLLPGMVIYTVSYQFVSRSIEAWFDVRVAGALDSGLSLGKETLEALKADVASKARVGADRLSDAGPAGVGLALERLREQLGAQEVSWIGSQGQVLQTAGAGVSAGPPHRPTSAQLRQARATGQASQVDGLDEEALAPTGGGATVRALASVPRRGMALGSSEERFLLVVQPVPRSLAANALAVQVAYSEYQQRALARDSLRQMYIGTLTLALILAVFAAVLLAIVLGNQLAKPLLLLADGVRQVAAGDLTAKPVFPSADELGGLTRSFAAMTAQVADARTQVQRGVQQLEAARTRLQTILDTLTAGVIVFDREGRIDTVNPGATRILQLPLSAWRGRRLSELPELAVLSQNVEQRFELLASSPEEGERDQWQESFELPRANGSQLTLLVRGATLPGGASLMVFDDITEVVSAQRSAAWSEVARRLAHEIKNPLTPIQLSAERLQMKPGAQAGRHRPGPAASFGEHHRQPGAGHAAPGERIPRLRAPARGAAEAAGPERPGQRSAGPVRPGPGQPPAGAAAGPRPAQGDGRRHPTAPGHPQPGAERAGRRGRPPRRPRGTAHHLPARRTRRGAGRAPGPAGQRAGFQRKRAQARLRTLRHHQGQGHRPGPGGGEEDCRRTWGAAAGGQPARKRPGRRAGGGGARFAIIFKCRKCRKCRQGQPRRERSPGPCGPAGPAEHHNNTITRMNRKGPWQRFW